MSDVWEQMGTAAQAWGITLTEPMLAAFRSYYEELVDWNTRVNLTRITSQAEVIEKHFLDSLACIRSGLLPAGRELELADLASGAGCPGIPLQLARPDLKLTLMEATGKKIAFLQHVVAALGLRRTTVVQGRAEELGHEAAHREAYDLVTARALGALPLVAELGLPLLRRGGHLIAMKGPQGSAELEHGADFVARLGGELVDTLQFPLPTSGDQRLLLIFRKQRATPRGYPRPWAKIKGGSPGADKPPPGRC